MILLALHAFADIGPAPTCPPGTHSEYLYGRHCPKDGFHMEAGPDGGVREVADAVPTPAVPTDPAVPAPIPEVAPAPVPAAPEPAPAEAKKCSTSGDFFGFGLAVVGLAAVLGRRR